MQLTEGKVLFSAWEEKEDTTLHSGNMIREAEDNAEYGSLQLRTEVLDRNERGQMRMATRVAFIGGDLELMQSLVDQHKIKDGTDHNRLWGKHSIIVDERLESELTDVQKADEYKDGYSEKLAGVDGIELTKDGEQIYRKTFLVHESEMQGEDGKRDRLIPHDPFDQETGTTQLAQEAKEEFSKTEKK